MAANPRTASRFEVSQQARLVLEPFVKAARKVAASITWTRSWQLLATMYNIKSADDFLYRAVHAKVQQELLYTSIFGVNGIKSALNLDDDFVQQRLAYELGLARDYDVAAYIARIKALMQDNSDFIEENDVDVIELDPTIKLAIEWRPPGDC